LRDTPDLRPAMLAYVLRPSRGPTQRIHWVVSATMGSLALTSIVGIGVAASIFSSESVYTSGVAASQALLLIAVSSDE
jgi:hypothetical protein